jgi:acyl-ACP thioesterase
MPVATYRFKIEGQQIGVGNRIKLSGIADVLQIAAWRHAEELGFGIDDMMVKENRTWALTRLHIEIDRYPKYGEEIVVKTWPKKGDRIFAFRDWLIEIDGNLIIKATSTYLMIDLTTRRPLSLEGIYDNTIAPVGLHAIEEPAARIDDVAQDLNREIYSSFSDLDVNNHVNNPRYLDWAQTLMPANWWKTHRVNAILVNFFNEVHADQSISIHGGIVGNKLQVVGKEQQKEKFKVELQFSTK